MSDAPTKKPRKWPRRLAVLFISLAALLGVLLGGLQSGMGKAYVLRVGGDQLLALTGIQLTAENPSGFWPFHMEVERLTLADGEGAFLVINDLTLELSGMALMTGRVRLPLLRAGKIDFMRTPTLPPSETADDDSGGVPSFEEWPTAPKWLQLDALQIDQLTLAEAVAGSALDFEVTGSLHAQATPPLHLSLRAPNDATVATLEGRLAPENLELALRLTDRSILSGLLKETFPSEASLLASGPVEAWTIELESRANDEPLLALNGVVDMREALGASLDATLNLHHAALAEWVPAELREILHVAVPAFHFRDHILGVENLALALRPEAPVATLLASLSFPLQSGTIDLTLSGDAPDINRFSPGLSETPLPLAFRLQGNGPLEQFAADLAVLLDGEEAAVGEATVAAGERLAASGNFVLHPLARIMGDAAEGLFEEGLRLDFAVEQENDVVYRIDRFVATAEANSLDATGHFSTALDDIALSATLQAKRLEDFAPLLPVPLSGAIEGAFQVTAGAGTSRAEGRVSLNELVVSDYGVARGELSLTVEGGPLPNGALEGLEAQITGRFEEITSPQYTSPQISLELAAQPAENGDIVLSALSISDGISSITGEGRFASDLADFSFLAKVAAEDLRPYVAESPIPPALRLHAELSAGRSGNGPIDYSLDLGARSRDDGRAEIRALLQKEGTLKLAGSYHENSIVVDTFTLESSALRLNGTVRYGLEDGALNASSAGQLPNLSALAPFIEQTLAGALDLDVEVSGTLATGLTARLAVQGQDVAYDTFRADQLRAVLDAEGLPDRPTGTAEIDAVYEGETLRSRLAFAQEDRRLEVSALELSLAENQLSGAASIHLDTLAIESNLALDMPRLEAFAAILGQPIAGAVFGELRVARAGERMALIGTITGSEVLFAPAELRIQAFQLDSDLSGVLPALEGTLALEATDTQIADAFLDRTRIEIVGDGVDLRYTASLNGRATQDYPLALEGAGAFTADLSETRLDRLDGTLSVFEIALQSPLIVQAGDDGFSAPPFAVQIGSGTLQGSGTVNGEVINAELSLRDFQLDELDELGLPSLQGKADASVVLTGTMADPEMNLEAAVADFYPGAAEEGDNVATLAIALNGRVAEGAASGDLSVRAEEAFNGAATASVPLDFRLSPFDLGLAPDAPLSGRLRATGDMAALVDALALRDHLVEGALDADFQLSGTVAAPLMAGEATWRDGRYENSETSTIYENLALTLTAEGRRVRLTQFEGTDPTGGTLRADGQIDLDPETGFPFRFEARAARTRIVHRDDLTAVVDGVLTLVGTTQRIEVTGDLIAGPATIVIPERMPPASMKVIAYEEVNREAADLPPQPPREAQAGPAAGPEIVLNIKVNVPNQVYVRAAALDSEWQGNLEIVGTAADPRIGGILRVVRGHVDFLGRRFDLRTSTISFDRAVPPSPFVDVTAATQTREVTARVRARGEFDNLEITMESEPMLPQDEVLAQVLFNRQLSEVSPLQAVQLAQAAAALRGGASGSRLLGGGSTVPGIDRLDFRQGATPGETAVGVGKNLGDNIYVEVQQSVGADSSKVLVQVEVTPRFSIEAEAGASATSGAGAFYKKDY